jgi:hypothetical protein
VPFTGDAHSISAFGAVERDRRERFAKQALFSFQGDYPSTEHLHKIRRSCVEGVPDRRHGDAEPSESHDQLQPLAGRCAIDASAT